MKGVKVLDSWALLAYFEGEERGREVLDLLKDAAEKGRVYLISVVNWGEILYITESRHGEERRDEVEHLMDQMHLEVVDLDRNTTRRAAELKATTKLHYADCFVAALAMSRKAELITGDHDFRVLENKIRIGWL